MYRLLILMLLFYLKSNDCQSQQSYEISGIVKDATNNTPLDFVSIYLKSEDQKIFAFTNTDESGHYSTSFEHAGDSLIVSANLLGYKEHSYKISASHQSLKQDFSLSPALLELNEIVVRETSIPIFERNDTTTYNLSSFTDSTEYSVEDALKKLPGVQISDDGAISVNGKSIDKILIEGDDMFGANYTIGTRNIRADFIDRVRVIDHFQDNPILKDVQDSDKMVIDLTIKKEKKRILSGTTTAGAGYGKEGKAYLHTNLFSFSKKSKSFLLGNFNNTGFNAVGELNATFDNPTTNNQSIERSKIEAQSLLTLPDIQQVGLPEQFTNNRRMGLANLSQVIKLNNQLKLKLTGTYVREKNNQSFFHNNLFFNSEDTLTFREDNRFSQTGNLYDLTVQTEYFPLSKKSSLKTYSNIVFQKNEVELFIDRKENNIGSQIPLNINEKPINVFNALEYTRKIGKNSAGQIILDNSHTSNPQFVHSLYDQYPLFFNLDSSSIELRQNSFITNNQSRVTARYIYRKNISVNFELGYLFKNTTLESNLDIQEVESNTSVERITVSKNSLKINNSSPFIKLILKRKIANIDFTSGITSYFQKLNIKDKTVSQRNRYWALSPFVRIEIPFTDDMKLRFSYTRKEDLPKEEGLNSNFIFSDYQTRELGILDFTPIKTHSFGTTLRYRDILKSVYLNAYFNYSRSRNNFGNSFDFTSNLFERSSFRPNSVTSVSGGFNVEKFFPKLNSRIIFRYNYNTFQTPNIINHIYQETIFNSHQFYLDYGSAFDGWFNLYFTNTIAFNKATTNSDLLKSKLNSINWKPKFKLLFKPNKYFYMDLNWYAISTKVQNGFSNQLSATDLNATLILKRKKKRYELKLSVVNMFSKNVFEINSINNYSQNQYGLHAVPRFFILKWDMSL